MKFKFTLIAIVVIALCAVLIITLPKKEEDTITISIMTVDKNNSILLNEFETTKDTLEKALKQYAGKKESYLYKANADGHIINFGSLANDEEGHIVLYSSNIELWNNNTSINYANTTYYSLDIAKNVSIVEGTTYLIIYERYNNV